VDTTGSTSSPGEQEPEEPGQEERLDSSTPVEPGPNASADLPAPADVSEEDTVADTPAIPPADEAPASPDVSEEDTRTDVPMAAPADWVPELPPPSASEPLGDGATQPWYPDEADTELLPPIFDTDDWPEVSSPSRPLIARHQDLPLRRHWSRRRRRYTTFVKRTSRARQAAKSATIARAAWASTIILLASIVSVLTASVGAAAAYYQSESSQILGLQRTIAAKDSVRIYDDKGILLYQFNQNGAQHSISLAQMPVALVNATVAIEDKDFWTNQGVDFFSIVRAAQEDLQNQTIQQGGSTITQQLIKGQLLGGNVQFTRKLNEAILAVGMTTQGVYSKRQILEMYLNSIPYSPTAYGVDAAAQEYFGYTDDPATGMTAAQHLDLAQAAMLAGVPQNPNVNDPLLNPTRARARMVAVLNAMTTNGYITRAQAEQAYEESNKPNFFHPVRTEQNKAPHFVYYVLQQLAQMIDTGQLHNLSRSGLNVYTTLDLDMQNHAQQAMFDHLYGDDQTGYCCGLIRNSNLTNAAEIIADHHTGAIKVYLGSVDYYSTKIDGKFDVVSQGYRGPGSSFKPFVYATAFEKGWFPALTIGDIPTQFWDEGEGKAYKPLDFDLNHMNGEVTLRTALDWSLNVPAVKVMQYAGVDNVRRQVQRMGITTWKQGDTWGLSSALGSLDVTPFEMAQAYTVFANYGLFIPLRGIDRITDSAGNELFTYHVPTPVQVMDPRVAFLMTSILTDNASRAGDFGACNPLYLAQYHGAGQYHFGTGGDQAAAATPTCASMYANHFLSGNAWPTAGKTGTGQDFTDDWTMGYTMDYTAAVWAGNNNHTSMVNIDGVTGAAPIFYESMLYAEESQNLPKRPFPVPAGVHQAHYCSNGVCTTDWFLDGPTPRNELGENGASIPCVQVLATGGWAYGPPCQIGMESKTAKNNGAPPPVKSNGQLYVGGVW